MVECTVRELSHPVWIAQEDINDADGPYLPSLFKSSFLQWFNEASELAFFQHGQFMLYGTDNRCHVSSDAAPELDPAGLDDAVGRAVRQVFETNSSCSCEAGNVTATAIPIRRRKDDQIFAVFVYAAPSSSSTQLADLQVYAFYYRSFFYRSFEQLYVKELLRQQERNDQEARRRDALFLAAKRLYDHINVTSVIAEMLHSLEQLYPRSEVLLYLSQDYVSGDVRVKQLVLQNTAHDFVGQAFLSGESAMKREDDGSIRLAVPLMGKQASYGVLCMTIGPDDWDESDVPAFLLLADTAGSAFENANLYEQSNMLIRELRLINEVTKRLNQSLRLNDIFMFATSELLSIFEADYCCVLQLDKESNHFVVKSSNIPAMDKEQFALEQDFSGVVFRTKEPVIAFDYWHSRVVPSKIMEVTDSRSLIAAPIFVDGEVIGVILVTHKMPNFFSYDNYKLLQVMSSHIGLAATNASLHAEVRRMVITDNLTGLHARHYLNEQILRRQRQDTFGSLILVDIDHFKEVNDTYGHQVGDRILIQVSDIIISSIRQGDIAARWGGEELAVYLPGIRSDQAFRIAERIRNQVAAETNPLVTVSCGVSDWSLDNDKISVESLFYRADMALYQAKKKGRNCIVVG